MTTEQYVSFPIELHFETERAYLISNTGLERDARWVPKSQCFLVTEGKTLHASIPEWMAIDKGFV